jgi:hypothetical protein
MSIAAAIRKVCSSYVVLLRKENTMTNVSTTATDQKPTTPANPAPASNPQQQQSSPKPADDKSGGQQK